MAAPATFNHESDWPELKSLAEKQDTPRLLSKILSTSNSRERVSLFRYAIRSLMFQEWTGKNLDILIEIADRAVEDTLVSAKASVEDRVWFEDQANIICYNMASNLADCWGDGFVRDSKHYEKGLAYANRAIRFRKELGKGPSPFFMAYWAKGAHELFLGHGHEAVASFETSLKYAEEAAKAQGKPARIERNGAFEVILASGYLSIARRHFGLKDEAKALDQALAAFEEMKAVSAEAKEDAEIGIEQLLYVRRRFGI